jgi:hypothetical protein
VNVRRCIEEKRTSGPEGQSLLSMDVRAEARTYPTAEFSRGLKPCRTSRTRIKFFRGLFSPDINRASLLALRLLRYGFTVCLMHPHRNQFALQRHSAFEGDFE